MNSDHILVFFFLKKKRKTHECTLDRVLSLKFISFGTNLDTLKQKGQSTNEHIVDMKKITKGEDIESFGIFYPYNFQYTAMKGYYVLIFYIEYTI